MRQPSNGSTPLPTETTQKMGTTSSLLFSAGTTLVLPENEMPFSLGKKEKWKIYTQKFSRCKINGWITSWEQRKITIGNLYWQLDSHIRLLKNWSGENLPIVGYQRSTFDFTEIEPWSSSLAKSAFSLVVGAPWLAPSCKIGGRARMLSCTTDSRYHDRMVRLPCEGRLGYQMLNPV